MGKLIVCTYCGGSGWNEQGNTECGFCDAGILEIHTEWLSGKPIDGDTLTTRLFANETEACKAAQEEGFEHERNQFEMVNRGNVIRLTPERERAYGTKRILGWRWKEVL